LVFFLAELKNIKARIINELLPFVSKPGRFLGNELGAICHPFENRVSIALAYPDLYDLGMSNLGLQILYNIINAADKGRAERVFAVSEDAAEIMREKSIPLFSLESKTPLAEFDLLGFNSATELNYTNILYMLDLAGIKLLSSERAENDPLVIIGGGCAFNPEPLADFADLFFLGDAEEAILEIIEALHSGRDLSREEKLKRLSHIEGVYVPSYYRPRYDSNGHFQRLERKYEGAPEIIKARTLKEIKSEYYPRTPLVPVVETVHDRLAVEIMRGCNHACRFCQATMIYRPPRWRKVDDITSQVYANLEKTGFNEITLLSLSSGDYPDIETLVRRLADKLNDKHITISLPSLRISSLSLELAELITQNQKTGLTFAPEAGTDRMRKVINKPLREEALVEILTEAFKKGWQTIKLYFMIGLPTETEDDLRGIADLLKKLYHISDKHKGKRKFNITISTFSPKPHTAWQWERQISIEEINSKRAFLQKMVRQRNIHLKFHDPYVSWLEGVLGRGDRRLGNVIMRAYYDGARMDGWSESFKFDIWMKAFEQENLDPDGYLAEKSTGDPLPWDHIEKGLSKSSLLKQLAQSRGLMDVVKSLDREEDSQTEEPRKKATPSKQITYGRTPKTVKPPADSTVPQSRLRIKWGRQGLARFLSHLDNMRALERAFRRANLPLSYSHGHKPHPKLSYGPPLALGLTSEAEYLDVQLDVPVQQFMINNLIREFAPEFSLLGTKGVFGKTSSLSSQINLAVYEAILPISMTETRERIGQILEADEFKIKRETKAGEIEVEVRSAIIALEGVEDEIGGTHLTMKTGMADLGFIKPGELLEQGFGLDRKQMPAITIHRKEMYRLQDERLIDPFDII
jgi:radical SAM family uncharacterized protein/radical SAM-linked protein